MLNEYKNKMSEILRKIFHQSTLEYYLEGKGSMNIKPLDDPVEYFDELEFIRRKQQHDICAKTLQKICKLITVFENQLKARSQQLSRETMSTLRKSTQQLKVGLLAVQKHVSKENL